VDDAACWNALLPAVIAESQYMRRGLQPRDGGGGRVAVLALDLISDFDFPDGPAVRRALARSCQAIEKLLAAARKASVPVIYCNDNIGPWRSDAPGLIAHCTDPRLPGAALVSALQPAFDDSIVLKPRHSAFFGTPLVAMLDDQDIDTLIIAGVSAESCVWMTACDAHTRGFGLVIPKDTMAGASAKSLGATLTGLKDVLKAQVPATASQVRLKGGQVLQSRK
jgi:nicotinamidase-related amidase